MHASIVAAVGAELGPISDALTQLGTEECWVLRNPVGDRLLFDPLPDFVIGVLSPDELAGHRAPNGFMNVDVMMRIGRTVERGLPALVIIPPPLKSPMPTSGVIFASCALDNSAALNLHLWAFISTLPERSESDSEAVPVRRTVDGTGILKILRNLGSNSYPGLGFRLEGLVADLLQKAGAELVAKQSPGSSAQIDIAFVPAEDSADVILVEIKAGLLSEDVLASAERQLLQFVLDQRAQLGVVIYHDIKWRKFPQRQTYPMIVRLSVEELVERLRSHSLPEVITDVATEAIGRL